MKEKIAQNYNKISEDVNIVLTTNAVINAKLGMSALLSKEEKVASIVIYHAYRMFSLIVKLVLEMDLLALKIIVYHAELLTIDWMELFVDAVFPIALIVKEKTTEIQLNVTLVPLVGISIKKKQNVYNALL